MSNLELFDEGRATIRILLKLSNSGRKFDRSSLLTLLKAAGVGRTAFYSSLNILKDIGLVEDRWVSMGNRRYVETYLTKKGEEIGELLDKLFMLLVKP